MPIAVRIISCFPHTKSNCSAQKQLFRQFTNLDCDLLRIVVAILTINEIVDANGPCLANFSGKLGTLRINFIPEIEMGEQAHVEPQAFSTKKLLHSTFLYSLQKTFFSSFLGFPEYFFFVIFRVS